MANPFVRNVFFIALGLELNLTLQNYISVLFLLAFLLLFMCDIYQMAFVCVYFLIYFVLE